MTTTRFRPVGCCLVLLLAGCASGNGNGVTAKNAGSSMVSPGLLSSTPAPSSTSSPTTTTVGGQNQSDAPPVFAHNLELGGDDAYAPMNGTVLLENGCLFYLEGGVRSFPLWPAGSDWDETSQEVVLPSGGLVSLNVAVALFGSFLPIGRLELLRDDPIPGPCVYEVKEFALIRGDSESD